MIVYQTPKMMSLAVPIDRADLDELVESAASVVTEGTSGTCERVHAAVQRVAPGYRGPEDATPAALSAASEKAPSWEGDETQRTLGARTAPPQHYESPLELVERAAGLDGHPDDQLVILTVKEFRDLCDSWGAAR